LGWLAQALGEVRDADVLTDRLRAHVADLADVDVKPAAALMRRLANQRNEARARLLQVLDSDRYIALLEALARAATAPPLAEPPLAEPAPAEQPEQVPVAVGAASGGLVPDATPFDGPPTNGAAPLAADGNAPFPMPTAPASEVLPALVRRPWRHLRQAVDALGDDPADEALHDVRIQAKRLRYAAEAAAPVIGRPARRLAAAVAGVQGVLGDFNDAVVAEEWLRQAAKSAPASTALVAGQLIAVERRQQQVGRDTWGKPWRAASSKKLRDWLKS
jgi:CHAD domain-containing protein